MRFEKLDLNLLVALDALLTTRNVSRAAERLFLSQPATSLALGRLRQHFDDDLLRPVGRTLVLTPLATELIAPVRDVLLQIQTISRARPSFDPATSTRRLVIESSDYVIAVLMSEVVRQAAQIAPLMQFDLRTISPQTAEHLESGEIELLVAPGFAHDNGYPSEALFDDGFSCLVCQACGPEGDALSDAAYFSAGHVGVEWGGGRRVTYDARLISSDLKSRRQEIIAPNFTLVPELLMGTSRIATLPTKLATLMAERLPVRVLPCPVRIPRFTEYVKWHPHRDRDPAIVWLREFLKEISEHC